LIGKILAWLVFLGLVAGAGYIWFGPDDGQEEVARSADRRAIPVVGVVIEQRDLVERLRFSGSLDAASRVEIAPRVAGRLDALFVDIGDVVIAGQRLARLDDDEFLLERARAESELAVARASVTEARASLAAADRSLQRTRDLRQQGVAPQADLDAAETRRIAEQARVELALAQVEQRDAALRSAQLRLSHTLLRAPGEESSQRMVSERRVDTGSILQANAVVLTLVDINPLRAVIHVPERDYARLQIGQSVLIQTDAWPDDVFLGTVARIAPVFLETSRQARVEIYVDNADLRLRPGMFVRSEIVIGEREQVPSIPASALVQRDDRSGVFLIDETDGGAIARFQVLSSGIRDQQWIEAPELIPGQTVVVLGQHLLTDGTLVQVGTSGSDP
jgi:RND family efflux transporter MFP subunit